MEVYDHTNAIYGLMDTPGMAERFDSKLACALACKVTWWW